MFLYALAVRDKPLAGNCRRKVPAPLSFSSCRRLGRTVTTYILNRARDRLGDRHGLPGPVLGAAAGPRWVTVIRPSPPCIPTAGAGLEGEHPLPIFAQASDPLARRPPPWSARHECRMGLGK